jgi:aspartate-semialdehyde dehydrogenase
MPAGSRNLFRVAIVGASTLRGKELKQVLEDRHFPASDILLYDETIPAGTLTEARGEPTFIRALAEDSFEGVRFTFFAGEAADAERSWQTARHAGSTVIDLSGALAARTGATTPAAARISTWIPSLSAVLPPPGVQGGNGAAQAVAYSSPNSAAIIACTIGAGLAGFGPQRIVVTLFPPVSEHGEAGVEELESQTANLLSFREIAKPVFDEQVAFNLLAGYGEESKIKLADARAAIARDVAGYLAGRAPLPAIQLVQAPVFYGYAFAAYAELASRVPPEKLEAAFAGLGVKLSAPGEAKPTNVSVAGESEIQMARIEPDPNIGNGVWLWGATNNVRLAATNAVRIAEEMVAQAQRQ